MTLISVASLGILALPLYGALMMMYVAADAGRKIEIGQIFKYLNQTVRLFIALVILAVLLAIGFICLVIPGLILAARWFYVVQLMIDQDMALGEAMSRSARMTADRGGVLLHIVAFVVLAVLGAVAARFHGIPGLVTFPLTAGFYGLAYANRRG